MRFLRRTTPDEVSLGPSPHLAVEIRVTEGWDQHKRVLNPSPQDYTFAAIMTDAGGRGASVRAARRKLDQVAAVRGYSRMLNDEEGLRLLRGQVDLADSIACIVRQKAKDKEQKKILQLDALVKLAPYALAKLRATTPPYSAEKLTKDERNAIITRYFVGVPQLNKSLNKEQHTETFTSIITEKPTVLPAVDLPPNVTEAMPATMTKKRRRPAAAEEEEEEMDLEEDHDEIDTEECASHRDNNEDEEEEEEEEHSNRRTTKRQRRVVIDGAFEEGDEVWVAYFARHACGEEEYRAVITAVRAGPVYNIRYIDDGDVDSGVEEKHIRCVVE